MSFILRFLIHIANTQGENTANELLSLLLENFKSEYSAVKYIKSNYAKEVEEMEKEHKKAVDKFLEKQVEELFRDWKK